MRSVITDKELQDSLDRWCSSVSGAYDFLDSAYWLDHEYSERQQQAIFYVLLLRAEQGWNVLYRTPKQRARLSLL